MRAALLLFIIAGCSSDTTGPTDDPTVGKDVVMSCDDIRIIVTPSDSPTAGREWLELTVTYTNVSTRSIWFVGDTLDAPFLETETRPTSADAWTLDGFTGCVTNADFQKVGAGESHTFTVRMPVNIEGYQFRVSFRYAYAATFNDPLYKAQSPIWVLKRPSTTSPSRTE